MDAERWQRLSPLLDVLLELAPAARDARLRALRGEDPELAADLDRLLALEQDNEDFIAEPILAATSASGLQAGASVGPYQLESPLGEGGMGTVWVAARADGLYQRRVALKLLRPGLADPDLRLRFSREREILARLEHPHIARLLDAGIGQEGQPYLALEYVPGIPITDYCQTHRLPLEARLKLFLQVCDAVSHAHANLIVHRDLKPSNILVTVGGEARLLDFGIAKLLDAPDAVPVHPRTEVRAFTLHYAAPEQVRGEPVTTMTDVYSLGVVLYELIAGTKPYRLRRQSDAEWERAILAVDPSKPSAAALRTPDGDTDRSPEARRLSRQLAGDLDTIALKALAKAPEHRYPSVEALAADLRRHLQGRPIQARPQSLGYRLRKYAVRHRWALAAGGLAALLLVAASAFSLWQGRQALREAARAQALQDFVIGLFDNAGSAQQGGLFDARKLLRAGEARGERELADQPLAHAELLGVIARLRLGLGDYAAALTALQRQQGLLDTLRAAPPALRLQSASQHARALRLLDRAQECVQLLAPLQSWAADSGTSPLQQAEFHSQLGRCRRQLGESQAARPLLEQSLALRRAAGDQTGMAENLYDLALLDNDQGLDSIAMRGFDNALAQLRQAVGDQHPLAVEIQRSRATLLRARGDTDAALAALGQALATARALHGDQHPTTLALQRQIVAVRVDQERYAEAERLMRPLLEQTRQALGPRHRETGLAWNSLGIIAWERGRLDEALADVGRAVDIWRGPNGAPNLAGGLFNYGMLLHDAGRDEQALAALNETRRLRVARLGASHALVGETDRMIGEALAAQGRMGEATASFDRALKLTRVGYGADDPRTRFASLSLARQYGRLGRDGEALALLRPLAVLAGDGSETPKLRWSARAYIAEIQCRNGEDARARRDLDALIGELHRERPDGGVITRQVEGIRAGCAAQTAPAIP